jgi:hypothetical protein
MVEFFFALVDAEDTTFLQDYATQDYEVLSFSLGQEEGEFAKLELAIKNPRAPLLGGSVWLWFSYSMDAAPAVPLFFGRLVGIPQSIFEERVTLEFVARPVDFNAQKTAIAEALKVLPYYDAVFIDEQRRDDLDAVMEAYPRAWHIDRVTHEVSTSDALIAEDGVITLAAGDILYNGFSLDFNQIPLTTVKVEAIFNWTQLGSGGVDISSHITDNWPNNVVGVPSGIITSYTLNDGDWPKPGASLGGGWVAADGTSCVTLYPNDVVTKVSGGSTVIDWGSWTDIEGNTGSVRTTVNESTQYLSRLNPPGSVTFPPIITDFNFETKYTSPGPDESGPPRISAINMSEAWTTSVVPLNHLRPTLIVGFDAQRPRKEMIRFNMVADLQPIVTLAGEDEVLEIKLNSVSLNDPLDEDESTEVTEPVLLPPIRDNRRRSYVVTERGTDSLNYLMALARANLWRRSRAVQVTERLTKDAALSLIPDITLRKNLDFTDPRLLGGNALGKIIAYRFALNGTTGAIDCTVTVGCAIGRGGEVTTIAGTPTYAEANVMGPDVQQFTGGTVLFDPSDPSVGYTPPLFLPNDDGVDFLTTLTADDLIEVPLSVENSPAVQLAHLSAKTGGFRTGGGLSPGGVFASPEAGRTAAQEAVKARAKLIEDALEEVPTAARFTLKSMTAVFEAEQDITVTELKIPTMIELETTA